MNPSDVTFSSVHLRERDRILQEKHAQAITNFEHRIERLKMSNNDILKQLFEAQARGNHLANSLGFIDISEAQAAVEKADNELSFKECFHYLEILERELCTEKARSSALQEEISLLKHENETLQSKFDSPDRRSENCKSTYPLQGHVNRAVGLENRSPDDTDNRASQELKTLQGRYDALLDVKERASARYKADYAKWRNFRKWIFKPSTDANEEGISDLERQRRKFINLMQKEKVFPKFGIEEETPTPRKPLGSITDHQRNKDNSSTPLAIPAKRKRYMETLVTTSSTVVGSPKPCLPPAGTPPGLDCSIRKSLFRRDNDSSWPSLSPTNNTRRPLPISRKKTFMSNSQYIDTNHTSTRGENRPSLSIPKARTQKEYSSDTEDDSQAVNQYPAPIPPYGDQIAGVESSVLMASSQTEPDSQSQISSLPSPDFYPESSSRSPPNDFPVRHVDTNVVLEPLHRPTELCRIDETPKGSALSMPSGIVKLSLSSSKMEKENVVLSPLALSTTPSQNTAARMTGDYSAFKGRGRYAKDSARGTINAQYVIDPMQNGGLDFQFEEVVRNKHDRQNMEAGDCEWCRDYYEAIGPLPDRLRPPLWRSPVSSPSGKNKSCKHRITAPSSECRKAEIDRHRKAISRHRHHWERSKTPPKYWSIGFPDTQEAADINKQAKELHEQKLAEVAKETAAGGRGRYKKRF